MDTQVSWLELFPPDIWACLSYYLPGEQLGRLLMTGATSLWARLRSPKVVKSIKLGRDFIVFKSFPKFLNDFSSIEELSLRNFNDDWCRKLGLRIELLPSGLKKLELSGAWDQCADKLFGEIGNPLKINEHLPQLESLDFWWLKFSNYSWLTHTPQSLTSLRIKHWDGRVGLPSSLVHFEAANVAITTSSLEKLPPKLESFVVTATLMSLALIVPLLPPLLRKLDLGQRLFYSDGPIALQNLLEQLPRSLSWLRVPAIDINFETSPEITSLVLPSALTVLDIAADFPSSAWPLFPQHLTGLIMNAPKSLRAVSTATEDHGVDREVQSFPFDLLPRSITSLELLDPSNNQYFCGPPEASVHSYFPPQLAYLKIPDVLSQKTTKLLPSSLTHLEIGSLSERVCEHLPKGLKTLISSRVLVSPNLIRFLPRSLTFLRLAFQNSLSEDFDWKDSSLPPTLTCVELTNAFQLGDEFLADQHLPNLLELRLTQSKNFTDSSVPLLSPHLTTLDLRSSSEISGKSFQFLPRGLVSLNLSSSESIADSDIQSLPRDLKQVYLNNAVHLSDICIPDLPPHLELLYLCRNTKITRSSFSHFPYPLRSSQLYTHVELARLERDREWFVKSPATSKTRSFQSSIQFG